MCMYITGPVERLLQQLGMIVVGLEGNGGILCGAIPDVARWCRRSVEAHWTGLAHILGGLC